jgi:hypothetical protein
MTSGVDKRILDLGIRSKNRGFPPATTWIGGGCGVLIMLSLRHVVAVLVGVGVAVSSPVGAGDTEASLEGKFVANGNEVKLPYVYVYTEKEGFYDEADPTWTMLFVEQPVEERDLDDSVWGAAYLRIKITKTSEFGDEPEIQVYGQDIRFSGDHPGNVSGGSYPEIELSEAGPDRFVGRIYHAEPQTIFDDTFHYDFSFSVPMSDPFGPIGDPLPEGGGEPGKAFVAWCEAVHAGDVDRIKALLPAEQAAMLDDEEMKKSFLEDLAFMQMMTPTEVEVVGGSSDGKTAILQVMGKMEGETAQGEITLEKTDGRWITTNSAW